MNVHCSIDASSSERKEKFINDEWRKPNACVQQLDYSMGPRLAIFAKREIRSGDEVQYNYGQTDAEWRKNVIVHFIFSGGIGIPRGLPPPL